MSLSGGGQMKHPQVIRKLRENFREQVMDLVDDDDMEQWPACLPAAGVNISGAPESMGTPMFFNWKNQEALPSPPGPAPIDYETLAALSPAKVKFAQAEFGEDDEDDEDYVPGNDDDEEEEDEAEGFLEETIGEKARVAGVSSVALAKVPCGETGEEVVLTSYGRPAWAVNKPYPTVAPNDVDLLDGDEDDEDDEDYNNANDDTGIKALGGDFGDGFDDDDEDDDDDFAPQEFGESYDDDAAFDDEGDFNEAAAAKDPLVPPPLQPVAGVPTSGRDEGGVFLPEEADDAYKAKSESPVSVALAPGACSSEYRASFAAPSADALGSPFKERRTILKKNRQVALSSRVFEPEVTARPDVARALALAKTAMAAASATAANVGRVGSGGSDAAPRGRRRMVAKPKAAAAAAAPAVPLEEAPLVPEPIAVAPPVGAPPLQPFPMSPAPTADKELAGRMEEIGDSEILAAIQTYATPGRMSAYLTEHVGPHWLRVVSSRAFHAWAKDRPHQFLSFVSSRYDNVAVTIKLYESGAAATQQPNPALDAAPPKPTPRKMFPKKGAGGATKPPPPPFAVEKGAVWQTCAAPATAPAAVAASLGGGSEYFGLDDVDVDEDAELAYAAARRGGEGYGDDSDGAGVVAEATGPAGPVAGSPSFKGKQRGKGGKSRAPKPLPAYMRATESWTQTVEEGPIVLDAAADAAPKRWLSRRPDTMAGRRPTACKVVRSKLGAATMAGRVPSSSSQTNKPRGGVGSSGAALASPELSRWSSALSKAAALRMKASRVKVTKRAVTAHLSSPIFANRRWGDAPLRKTRKNTEYNRNYGWK